MYNIYYSVHAGMAVHITLSPHNFGNISNNIIVLIQQFIHNPMIVRAFMYSIDDTLATSMNFSMRAPLALGSLMEQISLATQ